MCNSPTVQLDYTDYRDEHGFGEQNLVGKQGDVRVEIERHAEGCDTCFAGTFGWICVQLFFPGGEEDGTPIPRPAGHIDVDLKEGAALHLPAVAEVFAAVVAEAGRREMLAPVTCRCAAIQAALAAPGGAYE